MPEVPKKQDTFTEVYDKLNHAIDDVKSKKKAYDDSVSKVQIAKAEFDKASEEAQGLRMVLNRILDEALPKEELKPKIG